MTVYQPYQPPKRPNNALRALVVFSLLVLGFTAYEIIQARSAHQPPPEPKPIVSPAPQDENTTPSPKPPPAPTADSRQENPEPAELAPGPRQFTRFHYVIEIEDHLPYPTFQYDPRKGIIQTGEEKKWRDIQMDYSRDDANHLIKVWVTISGQTPQNLYYYLLGDKGILCWPDSSLKQEIPLAALVDYPSFVLPDLGWQGTGSPGGLNNLLGFPNLDWRVIRENPGIRTFITSRPDNFNGYPVAAYEVKGPFHGKMVFYVDKYDIIRGMRKYNSDDEEVVTVQVWETDYHPKFTDTEFDVPPEYKTGWPAMR